MPHWKIRNFKNLTYALFYKLPWEINAYQKLNSEIDVYGNTFNVWGLLLYPYTSVVALCIKTNTNPSTNRALN
jgi:hypothetical protein